MYPEPRHPPQPDLSAAAPSPDLRERVLRCCRQAMEERRAAELRKRQRWQWSLAIGAAMLLLFNAAQEHRTNARIVEIVTGGAQVVKAPLPPGAIRSFHARAILLAALLRDPDAL